MEAPADVGTYPNLLTVDVEDWFHLLDIPSVPPVREWHAIESRVVRNTNVLLDILDTHNVTATFFVLGWIGFHFPALVCEVERRGHEIATHGYSHQPLTELTPQALYHDIARSLKSLSPLCSHPIRGYRAPGFSLTTQTLWALDVLLDLGLAYDSSAFPARRTCRGISPIPTYQVTPKGRQIMEFPATPLRIGKHDMFLSGGGYFRLCPYSVLVASIRHNQKKGWGSLVYLHPRDVDISTPRLPMSLYRRFITNVGAGSTPRKLSGLLSEFPFTSIAAVLERSQLDPNHAVK